MTDEIDWSPLGEDWWREAGTACHATEQQIIFALHRHRGMTMTGCAKAANIPGMTRPCDKPVTERRTALPSWDS
jgi:hypothetical protein